MKQSTQVRYNDIKRLYLKDLEKKFGKNFTNENLQKYIDTLSVTGNRRTHQGLSTNTLKNILSVVKKEHQDERFNIKLPFNAEKQVEIFTAAECSAIIKAFKKSIYTPHIGIKIVLLTGLRLGELLGLTWQNINLEKGEIKIDKSIYTINENGKKTVIDTPKTKSGNRIIPSIYRENENIFKNFFYKTKK